MALDVTDTTTDLGLPVDVKFLNQSFLRKARPLLVYGTGAKQNNIPMNAGTKTVKWRRINEVAANTTALSEVTTASYMQGMTPFEFGKTDVTAAISKYGRFAILSEESVDYNSKEQMVELYEAMGISSGKSLNQLQRNNLEDGLTMIFAGGVASSGAVVSKITKESIIKALQVLMINYARTFTARSNGSTIVGSTPIPKSYWMFCHNYVAEDIRNMAGFKSFETYASHTRVMEGEIGMITGAGVGVRIIASAEAVQDANAGGALGATGLISTGGTNIDLFSSVIIGEDCHGNVGFGNVQMPDGIYEPDGGKDSLPSAIEIITKGFGSGGSSDPLNNIMTIGYKFRFGAAILNSAWGRVIRSGATNVTG